MEELTSSYRTMAMVMEVLSNYFKENYPDKRFIWNKVDFYCRIEFSYPCKTKYSSRNKYIVIRNNMYGQIKYLDKKIYFYLQQVKKAKLLRSQLELLGLEFKVGI